tara:strand:+ start:459 stop:1508 length:1050 start_codon:yes stop_codon:yes gene_type:complete
MEMLDEFFQYNSKCPLCGSTEIISNFSNYHNVYSELLSKEFNILESELLKLTNQKQCRSCECLYWERPISKKISRKLYTKIIPTHPKGQDSTGQFFSIKGLEKKLKGLDLKSTKRLRIIEGFIKSGIFKNQEEKKDFHNLIRKFKCKNQLNLSEENFLKAVFDRGPQEYSRHAGFRNNFIKDIIRSNLSKNNSKYQYIEYGCSDWGPLQLLAEEGFKCLNIIPDSDVFWNCSLNKKKGELKYQFINECSNFDPKNFSKDCFLSLFLILDHLHNPVEFIEKFVKIGVINILIMLEKVNIDKGLPVQHLSGWNEKTLKKLSKIIDSEIQFYEKENKDYIIAMISKNKQKQI